MNHPSINIDTADLPSPQGERHVLQPEHELRLEIVFSPKSTVTVLLQKGSCELFGMELPLQKPLVLSDGGLKMALFTWHGCVVDIDCKPGTIMEISYSSDETACNVAYVNTHAQLEALRDDAAAANNNKSSEDDRSKLDGPRVLICGPKESGKSSLSKVLLAYATKLGRTPLFLDLDPCDNSLSPVGTLSAGPLDRQGLSLGSWATTGLPVVAAAPLVLWHGSADELSPDLYKAQVSALGEKVNQRLQTDDWSRSSGIVVNTNGWIQDEGYQLLLHTVQALSIDIVLVMGHDRLYSMMKQALVSNAGPGVSPIKVIKVPRSGGVVSRGKDFLRQHRSRSIKRYFYGDTVEAPAATSGSGSSTNPSSLVPSRVPQLTPFLATVSLADATIYKLAAMTLSASLLPVDASQATEAVQLDKLDLDREDTKTALQHQLLAVCHPAAVQAFESSRKASDLVCAGIAGLCVVERVDAEDQLQLLSPCAGSLPSRTFLMGTVRFLE